MKNFIINIQCCYIENKYIPKKLLFNRWIKKIICKNKRYIITIKIVNELEMKYLNFFYRGKNKATNVLSFPCNTLITVNYTLLGDLVLCHSVIEKEAIKYNKTLESYWAHMTVHGILHLLGYEHKNDIEKNNMETRENKIMLSLNYQLPYIRN